MRKLIATSLLSISLLFTLALLTSGPTSAQAPNSAPTKGTASTPTPSTTGLTSSSIQIDRALLPKIEPQLLKKLLESDSRTAPFLVYLKAKTDVAAAAASVPSSGQGKTNLTVRRTTVIDALQQTARNSQTAVLQTLTNPPAGVRGQMAPATDIQPLWIVNAVAARGNLETVLALASRTDVEIVRLDKKIQLSQPILGPNQPTNCQPTDCSSFISNFQALEWGVAKIRADLVHNALDIDGSGVVVANIDTGVDWQHFSLQTKYRGYTGPGKLPQHVGNWYDATGDGATYPVDGNGHGTHTMGTMVGDGGLGVAPGAHWIAVRAFDSTGAALNSWLHEAFQWILAPNGDPALAPDIVNNSWGSNIGSSTEFKSDIQALQNAGIYPVFSAGNNGPGTGTVGSPGSLNLAFAVGATTIDDEIALFSGRGPSPWGKIKPEVSAPGKDIVSTFPGGTFSSFSGTSMAAPHVSGLAALLLQASPALGNNLNGISQAMKSTAVPLGNPIPNNNYGWGRIDAYNAVMSVASVGTLQGTVTRVGTGSPINGATIQITPRSGGPTINATSDASGAYHQGLAADTYDATAIAFGYEPVTAFNLAVITGTSTIQNFILATRPTGTLQGTVRDRTTNAPLAATISVDGTPASTTTNAGDGSYNLSLPIGVYTATVIAAQHRITKAVNITINDGATVTRDFLLASTPAILLVDDGAWYQESQIGYYQQALDDLLYPYDTWLIKQPFGTPGDVPTAATLSNYDLVIWSSPLDSPGYVGADSALQSFISGGGKLLLSGQDVAYYDAGGTVFGTATYMRDYLKATYVADDSGIDTVTGTSSEPFDGLSLVIAGGDGADNQLTPDVIGITDTDFAGPLLGYDDDSLAGLHIGLCVPYRAMFLSFGFEAINLRADREVAMQRTIDWLMQPPPQVDVDLSPADETVVGNFGTTITHTVRVRNTGTNSDLYVLTLSNGTPHNWPVPQAPPSNVSLASCQAQDITIRVTVDTANSWHASDTLTLTVQSSNNPFVTATATRTTKSPAPVLLVDDDRWFSFAPEFEEALETNNIPYDYWLVPKSWAGPVPPSPPLETLAMYPMTVWYTAYDWLQPLTTPEEDRLAAYLDGGGRLMFSSQDYIYNLPGRKPSPFAQNYLGILAHTEDFTSSLVTGEAESPVGTFLGPYDLTFPPTYDNWTDALTPTVTARIATRGQEKQPNGLTHSGVGPGGDQWQTAYFAFGPELLSSADRARLMRRSLGWLSWLGRSKITPSTAATLDGTDVTYTAVITNNGWDDLATVSFTATFPSELTVGPYSSELSPSNGNLVWSGSLGKNQAKVLTYTATIAGSLPLGTVISQTSWLAYPEHNILFDRVATTKVNFPALNGSTMSVVPTRDVEAGDVLTYTIVLKNTGLVDDPMVTTTNTLPPMLDLVSVDNPTQGTAIPAGNGILWTTPLARNEVATLTYQVVISYETSGSIKNTAYIADGFNDPVALTARTLFKSLPVYLPFVSKN